MNEQSIVPLRNLTVSQYSELLSSGLLWERYPNATGNWVVDCKPLDIHELYALMCETKDEAEQSRLYVQHFQLALVTTYRLNTKQASIVSYAAYERGHSAGVTEVVCCAMSLGELARDVLTAQRMEDRRHVD